MRIYMVWAVLGVIFQDDAMGSAGLEGVKRVLAKHNTEPIALGSFPRGTSDVDDATSILT